MSTVYAVQRTMHKNTDGEWVPRHDLTPAREFGDINFVCDQSTNFYDLPGCVRLIRERLQHIDENDYLLLVGNPAMIGLVFAIACELTGGKINVLQWDRQGIYIPTNIDLMS